MAEPMTFLAGTLKMANSSDLSYKPQNVRDASVGSRSRSASKIGNIATVLEKRNDKASFMACMFPYMHDCREHIMGFSNFDALS
jgi:hypothetical protein